VPNVSGASRTIVGGLDGADQTISSAAATRSSGISPRLIRYCAGGGGGVRPRRGVDGSCSAAKAGCYRRHAAQQRWCAACSGGRGYIYSAATAVQHSRRAASRGSLASSWRWTHALLLEEEHFLRGQGRVRGHSAGLRTDRAGSHRRGAGTSWSRHILSLRRVLFFFFRAFPVITLPKMARKTKKMV
jgi:hypothetical protein